VGNDADALSPGKEDGSVNDQRREDRGSMTDGLGADQPESSEELFTLVYDELRCIARSLFAREKPGHTLQPTALVNEAYLKLADQKRAHWKSRTHFLAVGAHAMRRLLVDHARKRGAAKRGSSPAKVGLFEILDSRSEVELDVDEVLMVNEALEKLALFDDRQALIVTLRFFGGLTVEEVAEVVGVSPRTVALDWRHAQAWLQVEISRGSP
jgi:RNA polymerase sigma factor (TIGR02999 family)